MGKEFSLIPRQVPPVETPYRRIATDFPVPESLPLLEKLYACEPVAMRVQPPVVWDRAEGCQVFDAWGNRWIDWSSGVLIANAGHGHPDVRAAIARQVAAPLLSTFGFPNQPRAQLVERLTTLLPDPLKKVFLFTTGSETIECALKLCRSYGIKTGGRKKQVIVSFDKAFHGRTLGALQAGGIPELKEWIVNLDPGFVQVPFPDGFRTPDTSFAIFEQSLREAGVEPQNVAGVLAETYQGGSAAFAPVKYMQALRQWCTGHKALLVLDEIQAGFGRTGKLWGFEHYEIVPDVATFGKGISSSLPLSALAGRREVLDLFPPGAMTSSHAGNPVCCAAALASIGVIVGEHLAENAARMGDVLHHRLRAMHQRFPQIGSVDGKGLVAGVSCVLPGSKNPDAGLAWDVVRRSAEKGVLMFAPVGFGDGTVKICPPLVITEAMLLDSLAGFEEAFGEAVEARAAAA